MALNQLGLGFLFTARDEASHTMSKIEGSFGRLNNQTKSLVKQNLFEGALGTGAMVGGLMGLRKAFDFAKSASNFGQALVDVQSISGGTAEDLNKLRDAAMQAGIATQFTPQEAVAGLRDLAQSGLDANDSIKLLQPSLDLAAGSLGQLNVEASAGTLVQSLRAFKLSASDAALTADKLLAVHQFSRAQIKELPSLIGHVARGAASYGASLEEALVATGLARNVMNTIELASTGVSMAMERLIDPKVQKVLHGVGVAAVDATGHFKPFLKVLLEMSNSPIFSGKNYAEQQATILKAFGKRSLGAVNAIMGQLSAGIKTKTGEMLHGIEAVNYLMGIESDAQAGGLARKFASRRLDTLVGQLKLLHGSTETFRIAIGDSLADLFKPMVEGFLHYFNVLLKAWEGLAPETKLMFGKIALGVMAVVTAFGALVALKASIVVLGALLGALGTTFGALAWSMAPVLAGVLALAAVSYIAYRAYKTNFGGLADVVHSAWQKISLAIRGIGQLFSSGAFSGDVMTAIDDVKNRGVKEFAITIFMWASRIKNFFDGVKAGFQEIYPVLEPVLKGLMSAISRLADAFGLSVGKAEDNAAAFDKWGAMGRDVGLVLGQLAILFVDALAFSIDVVSGAIKSLRENWFWIKPALLVVAGIGIAAWASSAATAITAMATAMGTLGVASFSMLGWVGLLLAAIVGIYIAWGKVLDLFGLKDIDVTPSGDLSKFMNSPSNAVSTSNFMTPKSEEVDASGQPVWMGHKGVVSSSESPASTAAATAAATATAAPQSAINSASMDKLIKAIQEFTATKASGTTLKIDGQTLAATLEEAMKKNQARSYQATSSGSVE
jgi:TP901 family phage tail tape measure protein